MKKYNIVCLLFGLINLPLSLMMFNVALVFGNPNNPIEIYVVGITLLYLVGWVILKMWVKKPSVKHIWVGNLASTAIIINHTILLERITEGWVSSPWELIWSSIIGKVVLDIIMSVMVTKRKSKPKRREPVEVVD